MSYDNRERERVIPIKLDKYIEALSYEEVSDLIDYIDEDELYSSEAIKISEDRLQRIKPKLLDAARQVYKEVKKVHESHIYPMVIKKIMQNQKYAKGKDKLKRPDALKEMHRCFEWISESKFIKGYVEEIFRSKSTKEAKKGCEILVVNTQAIRKLIGENMMHSIMTTILNLPDMLMHAVAVLLEKTRSPLLSVIGHIAHIILPAATIVPVHTLKGALTLVPVRTLAAVTHSAHTGTNIVRNVNYTSWMSPNKWFGFGWRIDAGHVVSRITYNSIANDYVLVVYPKFKIKK